IVNAQLLHTSNARIHADGDAADWGHDDGGQHGLSAFYRMYLCADDVWLFVAALEPEQRARLAAAIGENALALTDDDKATATLEARLREKPAAAWFSMLDAAGVPVEIVDEAFCRTLFDDSDARASGLVAETWAGGVGRFEDPGLLVTLSETPGAIARGPCMCGEHSREILTEYGYSTADIDALVADRVVLDAPIEKR
ncbi:MAG: hypothetical protein QOI55_1379, partial [Actinomycetota bacterium]|nr:hypothetical protein [Actinomycetota bacterium]